MQDSAVLDKPFIEKLAKRVSGQVLMLCVPHMHNATAWSSKPVRPRADRQWSEGGLVFTPTRNYCDACDYLKILPVTCACCSYEGATSSYAVESKPDNWLAFPTSQIYLCPSCRKLEPFDQFSKFHWRLKARYPYLHIHTSWVNIATVLTSNK